MPGPKPEIMAMPAPMAQPIRINAFASSISNFLLLNTFCLLVLHLFCYSVAVRMKIIVSIQNINACIALENQSK